jgi:TonB-dependent starch-binding outer membrane protein SusC
VIDGVPLAAGGISGAGNPLSFINPNDIESFTVLVTEIIFLKLNNKYA